MQQAIKRIGVLTSGGDAPGMNACIRAVVRQAIARDLQVLGIRRGYEGLIDGEIIPMTTRSVGGIMHTGGTVLLTARSERFLYPAVRKQCVQDLHDLGMDGLVVIGGNGSFRGALELSKLGLPVVGVPGSIDNDVACTDMAIGVDTCLNTILDAVDKIKDTAGSLHRPFIIEVMGRHCGYLATQSGLAGGAELVVTPEASVTLEEIGEAADAAYRRGKPMFIAIVAEGAPFKAQEIYEYLKENHPGGTGGPRLTILGHIQRGGRPSAADRILATRLGVAAVDALIEGNHAHMVGLVGREVRTSPLTESIGCKLEYDPQIHEIAHTLAI